MTTPRVILTTLLLCTSLLADSKTEADLRIRLAASEAAHAAALRDKADLTAALAKLTAQDSAQTARASIASQSASAQRSDASTAAATNAASASDAAAAATLSAQIAAQHGVMITQVGGFLALLAGFLYKGWTESRDRRWAKQDEVELAAVKKAELLAHQQIVLRKLDEVKTEANAAYKEANTVNLKLQTIGVKMADDKPLVSYPAK